MKALRTVTASNGYRYRAVSYGPGGLYVIQVHMGGTARWMQHGFHALTREAAFAQLDKLAA